MPTISYAIHKERKVIHELEYYTSWDRVPYVDDNITSAIEICHTDKDAYKVLEATKPSEGYRFTLSKITTDKHGYSAEILRIKS